MSEASKPSWGQFENVEEIPFMYTMEYFFEVIVKKKSLWSFKIMLNVL